ncbi:conserved hypothetical protein [Pirellula staleyi DSM 6068]|uniref:DUF2817 domain-containing protein n=1 Tax=Pirellula staleyi (strain ATCC 27377 / DSM 6068 / ICPB 4128) TaxID=530564 RepID=D2QYE7_PIRSD|nr:M14 family metallopeptidase [Pirellula staleyi]ADB16361.1 conserved hypothetical protein [Pirellula staleyi DSM 6068]
MISLNYAAARQNFLRAARSAGATVESLPLAPSPHATGLHFTLGGGEPLGIDVAILGSKNPQRTVVVSSGVHGVEGPIGSAVQTAWLRSMKGGSLPSDTRVVLLHALNPVSWLHQRRVHPGNIDLNRNFLLPGECYSGRPPGWDEVSPWIHPSQMPSIAPGDLGMQILQKFGPRLLGIVPVGQYDVPEGLFYGGDAPLPVVSVLATSLPNWVGSAQQVIHLDLHSGLGEWCTTELLLCDDASEALRRDAAQRFRRPQLAIKPGGSQLATGAVYPTRGGFDRWCVDLFRDRSYLFVTVEFGTYPLAYNLGMLVVENYAANHLEDDDPQRQTACELLLATFCPRHAVWQQSSIDHGLAHISESVRP